MNVNITEFKHVSMRVGESEWVRETYMHAAEELVREQYAWDPPVREKKCYYLSHPKSINIDQQCIHFLSLSLSLSLSVSLSLSLSFI